MNADHLNVEGLNALAREEQGPVVMVNLMRFNGQPADAQAEAGDGSGWQAYLRYSAKTVPMIKERGGTLLWTGNAKTIALGRADQERWDYVALVYYPSIAAFLDMVQSAEYLDQCDPERRAACAEHVIICTREAYSKLEMAAV